MSYKKISFPTAAINVFTLSRTYVVVYSVITLFCVHTISLSNSFIKFTQRVKMRHKKWMTVSGNLPGITSPCGNEDSFVGTTRNAHRNVCFILYLQCKYLSHFVHKTALILRSFLSKQTCNDMFIPCCPKGFFFL